MVESGSGFAREEKTWRCVTGPAGVLRRYRLELELLCHSATQKNLQLLPTPAPSGPHILSGSGSIGTPIRTFAARIMRFC